MAKPVKLIDILSNLDCDDCEGLGTVSADHPETGKELLECDTCLGSGYNQWGLILSGILKPPPEGSGPVDWAQALRETLHGQFKETATHDNHPNEDRHGGKKYKRPLPKNPGRAEAG